MKNINDILAKCKKQNAKAQKALYDYYNALMFGLCRRYVRRREDAEDVVIEGWYKIFSKIHQYSGNGSFEGWMKRIMVNEALMYLRKNNNFNVSLDVVNIEPATRLNVVDQLQYKDVIKLLDELPTGYRTVFNLYEVEGYKHREIGELLGISINTSKSQLILAKKKLRGLVKKKEIIIAS